MRPQYIPLEAVKDAIRFDESAYSAPETEDDAEDAVISFHDFREYPEPAFTGDLDVFGRPLKAGT